MSLHALMDRFRRVESQQYEGGLCRDDLAEALVEDLARVEILIERLADRSTNGAVQITTGARGTTIHWFHEGRLRNTHQCTLREALEEVAGLLGCG